MTISALPCDVLLEIFKFYVDQIHNPDAWHKLVHVCREWRDVVFASPRWLNLELLCTDRRPVKKRLDVWLVLPIVVAAYMTNSRRSRVANVIAALKLHNVVCRINIWGVPNSLLESAAIKKPFPELTHLTLHSIEQEAPAITDSFLGGSAPRLQSLEFKGIQLLYPALGKLLLSATDLVTLRLENIPNSGIVSPELLVTSLSTLTRLQELLIGFRSPRSRADRERRNLSLLKRVDLPSLTKFRFKGDSEYLEDIAGRIDAPALGRVTIIFFNQLLFDLPLLRDFFSRTVVFREPHRADVFSTGSHIHFRLCRHEGVKDRRILEVAISCTVLEWQLSSLAQFCSASIPPLPTLERLSIYEKSDRPLYWSSDMEGSQWLELLNPFVTVRYLDLSLGSTEQIAPALGGLTGNTVREVLPALREVCIEACHILGPHKGAVRPSWEVLRTIREGFTLFTTARQLLGFPVALYPVEIVTS